MPKDVDVDPLFLMRLNRRVRKDATISLGGVLWEGPVHLRGLIVTVHFDPVHWSRVEVWWRDRFIAQATRCKRPQYRRGDNVLTLAAVWQEWAPLWSLVIIEEAQDLNTAALEELRLLTTARADTQSPFSLVLVGDEDLLPRLDLGVNRALMSRLGFCLRLDRWKRIPSGLSARASGRGRH